MWKTTTSPLFGISGMQKQRQKSEIKSQKSLASHTHENQQQSTIWYLRNANSLSSTGRNLFCHIKKLASYMWYKCKHDSTKDWFLVGSEPTAVDYLDLSQALFWALLVTWHHVQPGSFHFFFFLNNRAMLDPMVSEALMDQQWQLTRA